MASTAHADRSHPSSGLQRASLVLTTALGLRPAGLPQAVKFGALEGRSLLLAAC